MRTINVIAVAVHAVYLTAEEIRLIVVDSTVAVEDRFDNAAVVNHSGDRACEICPSRKTKHPYLALGVAVILDDELVRFYALLGNILSCNTVEYITISRVLAKLRAHGEDTSFLLYEGAPKTNPVHIPSFVF